MFQNIITAVNNVIWSPALVALLIFAGLFLSFRTRFIQVRRFGHMLSLLARRNGVQTIGLEKNSVSSFGAFCLAISGRVGTGNIVGVATAIGIGGPGAVFWMWITAFLGASTAFVESTLAQIFRFGHGTEQYGGPSAYIHKGLGSKLLGVVFAVTAIVGYSSLLTTVQSNGVSSAFENSFNVPPIVSGVLMALLLAPVLMGGLKIIVKVASIVSPLMSIGYILISLIIVLSNWRNIPDMFTLIFTNAFGVNPLCGGILGSTIMMGVKRGIFSNEAGQGCGAIISATADVSHPAQQGLVQAFSVYVDTLLVCTATALMILSAGTYNIVDAQTGQVTVSLAPELGANFVNYTQAAVNTVFHGFGGKFVAIALLFFVFTSLMAYYYYVESSIVHICHHFDRMKKYEKCFVHVFRTLLLLSVIYGAVHETLVMWQIGDIGVGVMAWINVVVILVLSPKAISSMKDYESGL